MYKLFIIVIFFILINKIYNHKIIFNIINDPDIIIAPAGNMGYYCLGICHYIKQNYNIENKKIVGFSSGTLNTIFMGLKPKYEKKYLDRLFKMKLNTNMNLNILLKKTNNLLYDLSLNKINMTNKYIITLDNMNTINQHNKFSEINELIKCCEASCFIPLLSSNFLIKYHKNNSSFDPGIYYKNYKNYIINKKTLLISYRLFQRFRYKIDGFGLLKHNYNIYELYTLGYKDAKINKLLLDYYLL